MTIKYFGSSAQTLFDCVRQLIESEELKPGDALPSVRDLAEQLDVNRNTVSSAYKKLAQAGLVVSQGRLGTKVSPSTSINEYEGIANTKLIDLADGNPLSDWLPDLNQLASHTKMNQYLYGEGVVLPELIELGKNWFSEIVEPDFECLISNGTVDALERILFAHLRQGDKIAIEDPAYLGAANSIRIQGYIPVGLRCDENGILPDSLQSALEHGIRAVVVTPRAQNPSESKVTAHRIKELQAVLTKFPHVLILEDDHFALLSQGEYQSLITPQTMHFSIIRSVSKGLGPDFRLALSACDKHTYTKVTSRLAPGMSWVSRIVQSIAYTALTSESTKQLLAKVSNELAERRQQFIDNLNLVGITQVRSDEGLSAWLKVPTQAENIVQDLAKKGWLVKSGDVFFIDDANRYSAIRITISKLDNSMSQQLAADIAEVFQKYS